LGLKTKHLATLVARAATSAGSFRIRLESKISSVNNGKKCPLKRANVNNPPIGQTSVPK
jgi:hypothetical protein